MALRRSWEGGSGGLGEPARAALGPPRRSPIAWIQSVDNQRLWRGSGAAGDPAEKGIRRRAPITTPLIKASGGLVEAKPRIVTEMLAALTIRYPTVPIHFARTRPLARRLDLPVPRRCACLSSSRPRPLSGCVTAQAYAHPAHASVIRHRSLEHVVHVDAPG